ncbi:structural protein [Xenorhabdus szentirmaii]|uniref:structural protein n=1 Tax=Xenorhabdus szentirmaii TaxID=290112 RepID=UPI0019B4CA08|nr:structural protein [Xenorhabdus sp. 5]MBD2825679.1 structural protein [Xenorhabdus sp. 5]
MSRGIRNHNPGNIRHGDKWQGLREHQTDADFCQFIAPEWGIRAMFKILRTYRRKYGDSTLRQFISRWAPPNENDTERYITDVARMVNIASDAVVDVDHQATITALAKAMIRMENGQQPYSDDVFTKAYERL